ncbi:MAG TPA: type II toxin-antitoxin system VapC family toxin [Devosia sp.]|nr:type II toxin-antitoxin system VapC family toxin [Devosia sp.]
MIVLDASVALTWCFEDERRNDTAEIGRRILAEGATVPNLFHLELASAMLAAERRGRIDPKQIEVRLALIAAMPIEVDLQTARSAWTTTLPLARANKLTPYDAAYLELAMRLGAKLATLDDPLAAAAGRHGIAVLP